jgi:hypothetical protein
MQPFRSRPTARGSGSLSEDPWSVDWRAVAVAFSFPSGGGEQRDARNTVRWNAARQVVGCTTTDSYVAGVEL